MRGIARCPFLSNIHYYFCLGLFFVLPTTAPFCPPFEAASLNNKIDQKTRPKHYKTGQTNVILAKKNVVGIDTREDYIELKKILEYKT